MNKVLRALLPCILTALALAAHAQDSGGEPPPRRIVCLAPNLTEIVFDLGCGDDVVGVTDFCRFPPEAASRTHVGGLFDANAEVILSLRPTIVLLTPSHQRIADRFTALSVDTLSVKTETIADIKGTITIIGAKLDVSDRAAVLAARMEAELDALRDRSEDTPPVTVLMVVGYAPDTMRDIYAVGASTFLGELLTIAGGDNIMKDAPVPYPLVSREVLIANPPDILIDSNGTGKVRTLEQRERLRAQWFTLLGGENRMKTRVIFSDDPHTTIPGSRVAETAKALAAMLHDDRAMEPPR